MILYQKGGIFNRSCG